jgi:YVTN family beta-propeller protein
MSKRQLFVRILAAALLVGPFLLSGAEWAGSGSASAASKKHGAAATRSSPIAITHDDAFVWSVNPDNDSVSVFRVPNDQNIKVAEIAVGKEPWCVAVTPDDEKAYVTNMASGTVSVISTFSRQVINTIKVGTEPFGCAITPDGRDLYVANQSSGTVSVINTRRDKVTETIENVGVKPHGIAISADGARVFVTQFLALKPEDDPRPLTQSEGADDGREGRVTVIKASNNKVIGTIRLTPLADVGAAFRSDGNTLNREPLSGTFDNVTGAFPNLLESITIKDDLAYIPGTCSSPNGPFRFNVNVQSCLSTIDIKEKTEAFKTLNMNVGVNFEPVGRKLFNTNPFAVAFKQSADEGFITLGATNRLLRVTLNGDGSPTISPPLNANDPGNIVRIQLKDPGEINLPDPDDTIGGHNPRGVVLNSDDTRAYVMDFLSRDIAIVDVSGNDPQLYRTLARVQSADLPAAGTDAGVAHRGKYLFNTSIGPEGSQPNSVRPSGRMSDTGWGSCYSCHPNALTDTVTWMFADGPRQAISMESTFEFGAATIANGAPVLPDSHQRALNWSAVRDEVQDFTRNVRAVSGGGGLVRVDANGNPVPEGTAGLAQLPDLRPTANGGLNADLDAIATYLATGVRAPISPIPAHNVRAEIGRTIFEVQGCQNCHGGKNWTISALDSTPPPLAAEVVDAQLVKFLCRVGTFDPSLFTDGVSNEIRANAAANTQARGTLGFNVPSLISVFASAPYLHSGAAASLDDVLANVTHRTAGRADRADFLGVPAFRRFLVQFLMSIDRDTPPVLDVNPPLDVCGPQ